MGRVALQRFPRRRRGIRAVVLFEEQLRQPYARIHVVGTFGDGFVEGLERVLEELGIVGAESPARACDRRELLRGERGGVIVGVDEPAEAFHGLVALAPGQAERREVHLGRERVGGRPRDRPLEGGLRLRVAAARGQHLAEGVEELGGARVRGLERLHRGLGRMKIRHDASRQSLLQIHRMLFASGASLLHLRNFSI